MTNQYPPVSFERPQPPAPTRATPDTPPPPAWKLAPVALVMILLLVGGLYGLGSLFARPVGTQAALVIPSTPTTFQPQTNTPADTAPPKPSRTPWPSFTPTTTTTPAPQIKHIEITRLVEVTVERIITATPLPSTPTDTPTPVPTLPMWLVKQNHDIEMTIRREGIGMALAEFFLSPGAISVGVLILSGVLGLRVTVRWKNEKLAQAEGHETRAQVAQQAADTVDESLHAMLALLDESARLYGAGEKRLAGWREMVALDTKWAPDYWGDVIKDFEALGLRTVRQSGQGTFLVQTTIRTAKLYVMRLSAPPSPTA